MRDKNYNKNTGEKQKETHIKIKENRNWKIASNNFNSTTKEEVIDFVKTH